MAQSVFVADGDGLVATELARGPWDPAAAHGGAPAALLVRAFEGLGLPPELMLARVTYEFLRPLQLGALSVSASVTRAGRRVARVQGSVRAADGGESVQAQGLYVHRSDVDPLVPLASVAGPESSAPNDLRTDPERPAFATDAMEIRFAEGKFWGIGPATAWFRLRVPLVAGEEPSAMQRLAAAGDFGNGISTVVPWEGHLFINPDLTLYLEREPVGDWICLDAQTRVGLGGVGLAESVLLDERGFVGRAVQSLLVQRTSAT